MSTQVSRKKLSTVSKDNFIICGILMCCSSRRDNLQYVGGGATKFVDENTEAKRTSSSSRLVLLLAWASTFMGRQTPLWRRCLLHCLPPCCPLHALSSIAWLPMYTRKQSQLCEGWRLQVNLLVYSYMRLQFVDSWQWIGLLGLGAIGRCLSLSLGLSFDSGWCVP